MSGEGQVSKFAKEVVGLSMLAGRFGVRRVNWKAWKRITVCPSLGLAYNRIKKNANTTVVMLLREMETGAVESRKVAKDNSRNVRDLSFSEMSRVRDCRFFVVVRNPYSRVLSAFLNRFASSDGQRHGRFDLTPAGFAAFVDWLDHGGLDKNAHWDLQSKLMFLPLEKYDRVVRFENFKPEMLSLLQSRGLTPPPGRLDGLYPTDTNKRTSSDRRLQEFYDPRIAAVVARLYARDFDALDYSKVFPGTSS
ncbi:sulfotransferase family 2 domain-containing protein [Mesorhizobium marinum]|uniref:Sulfotransferase family 2 domain-containing protein n=1 Tax=Mesorhizobium marinum TaxID=3228790 RepID=A0ABV3R181_9HYPH